MFSQEKLGDITPDSIVRSVVLASAWRGRKTKSSTPITTPAIVRAVNSLRKVRRGCSLSSEYGTRAINSSAAYLTPLPLQLGHVSVPLPNQVERLCADELAFLLLELVLLAGPELFKILVKSLSSSLSSTDGIL